MNVHDSERLAGLLEQAGYARAERRSATTSTWSCSTPARCARTPTTGSTATSATCIRPSSADPACRSRSAAAWRRRTAARSSTGRPGSTSCSAPTTWRLPVLLERARHNARGAGRDRRGAAELPVRPAQPARVAATRAWVSISVGCDNTCTFCIVPSLRGSRDRPATRATCSPRSRRWSTAGVVEVTLLGQNVNSYGRSFGDPLAFGKLLRACGEIDGLRAGALHQPAPARLHRRRDRGDGRDAQRLPAAAHADAVRLGRRAAGDAPQLPAASATWRSSTRVRAAMPARGDHHGHHRRLPGRDRGGLRADAATPSGQARFAQRVHVPVLASGPGRRRPTMGDQVPKAVVQERYERLIALQDEIPGTRTGRWSDAGRGARQPARGSQGRGHRTGVRPRP